LRIEEREYGTDNSIVASTRKLLAIALVSYNRNKRRMNDDNEEASRKCARFSQSQQNNHEENDEENDEKHDEEHGEDNGDREEKQNQHCA